MTPADDNGTRFFTGLLVGTAISPAFWLAFYVVVRAVVRMAG